MLAHNGYKWVLVATTMVLGAWFGYSNQAYAVTYGELNAQREQAGLPLLTGDDQTDFQMLVRECNRGIRYSCALARQLQGPPQQQQRAPVYTPQQGGWDLRHPLQGLPRLNDAPQSSGGGGYVEHSTTNRVICRGECVKKCSIMPTQESQDSCHREEQACQARCP